MNEPKVVMSLMFFTMSFAFYFITALFYVGYWVLKKEWMGQTGTAMAFVALASTTMILITRAMESGHAPFANLYESMILFVWALNIGYLVMEFKHKLKVIGAFVMPIAFLSM
ncbi:MAG: hypothetical protein V3W31_01590, partial [Thermodesulfobacteriota bacterium]